MEENNQASISSQATTESFQVVSALSDTVQILINEHGFKKTLGTLGVLALRE
jgi:hypothetical protein